MTLPTTARPTRDVPSGHVARRRTPRLLAVGALVAALVALPTTADAHVRVIPESTTADGWTTLTFRVPNESETATTTGLTVELPTDTPLLYVSTKPVPGWQATIEKADLPEPVERHGATITQAPVRVVWTASPGAEISQGQFQEFEISAGPLPEAGTTLVLPADQAYSDGTVVSWDEVADGDEEPERPAPVFTTTADEATDDAEASGASGADAGDADATDADAEPVSAGADGSTGATGSDPVARGLGVAALVAALAAAVLAWRRRPAAA